MCIHVHVQLQYVRVCMYIFTHNVPNVHHVLYVHIVTIATKFYE